MTQLTTRKCDVCGGETLEQAVGAGTPWATLSAMAGSLGPHPYLTGPHVHQSNNVGCVDVCSAECALKWLRERVATIEANVKEWDAHRAQETLKREQQEQSALGILSRENRRIVR
jgi:hypothetical protein